MKTFNYEDYLSGRFLCSAEGEEGGDAGGGNAGGTDGGDNDEELDKGGLLGAASSGDGEGEEGGDKGDGGAGNKQDQGSNVFELGDEKINVPDKFWDKDGNTVNVGAVLKSALESEKAIGKLNTELAEAKKTGKGEIPKDADSYITDDDVEEVEVDGETAKVIKRPDGLPDKVPDVTTDDPVLKSFAESCLKRGISKDQFVGIVQDAMALAGGVMADPIDPAKELERLGTNGKQIVQANRTWLDGLHDGGEISNAEWTRLINVGRDAVGVAAISKLRQMAGGQQFPVGPGGVAGELPSREEWYASKPDHRKEPDKYEEWRKQGEELFGTAPGGSSPAGMGMPASHGVTLPERKEDKGKKS